LCAAAAGALSLTAPIAFAQTPNANTVYAGPSSGGAGAPLFRSLVGADLPFFGFRADFGGTNNVYLAAGTPLGTNDYYIAKMANTEFNQGGDYSTSTFRWTPPANSHLVHFGANIWVVGGAASSGTNGSFVAKIIKNATTDSNGYQCQGINGQPIGNCATGSAADICAGIGTYGSAGAGTTSGVALSCYDSPSSSDYYSLFLYFDGAHGASLIQGSISGTTLCVTSTFVGAVAVGQTLFGPGITSGTTVTASGGSCGGTPYTVSVSQTVASEEISTGSMITVDGNPGHTYWSAARLN
jgi:hypothetical protein